MTVNSFSKTLKREVSFDITSVKDRQDAISGLASSVKTTTFDNKVRLFALAPLAVAEYDDIVSDSTVKRTQGEHAELMGLKGPMFSMMRQVVTILTYGSGADRDGGWGDVTIGTEKVRVITAWDRLVNYRADNRDPKDVVMPLAGAAAAVLGDEGEARFSGLVEMFESFPGGMSGLYNLARGRNADGSKVEDESGDDDQGDDDENDDDSKTSWEDMLANVVNVARSQGASDEDIAAKVMSLLGA